MSIEVGYLLPTRERIVVGIHETGPILALADHAEKIGLDAVWIGDSLLAKPHAGSEHLAMRRTTVTTKRRLVDLFPAIEPFRQSKLKVSDLHTIHYEECGNPRGKPLVFFRTLGGGVNGGVVAMDDRCWHLSVPLSIVRK